MSIVRRTAKIRTQASRRLLISLLALEKSLLLLGILALYGIDPWVPFAVGLTGASGLAVGWSFRDDRRRAAAETAQSL